MSEPRPLVLSLFPGIGLLDRAFEEAGFCVVRGPDVLWGGDVRRFHPPSGRFDGVIGGPPCQAFSRFRHINPLAGQKHGNLIPEYERIVAQSGPAWFVMENVADAPLPAVVGYTLHAQLMRDDWVGGRTKRERRISFGTPSGARLRVELAALHTADPRSAVAAGGGGKHLVPVKLGGNGKVKRSYVEGERGFRSIADACEDQGLPRDFLADCPMTDAGKRKVVGNGVPLSMGRAIAKAVRVAMYPEWEVSDAA